MLPVSLLAQSTLNGVVVDSKSNQPLPGVNVIVEGAQQSAVTDLDGKFQLSKLKKNDVISFSFIGFTDQKVVYNNQKTMEVKLQEAENQLQELLFK